MRKTTSMILLAAMLLPALSACGGEKTQERSLTVFAAASLTETLTELKTVYEKDHPGVTKIGRASCRERVSSPV